MLQSSAVFASTTPRPTKTLIVFYFIMTGVEGLEPPALGFGDRYLRVIWAKYIAFSYIIPVIYHLFPCSFVCKMYALAVTSHHAGLANYTATHFLFLINSVLNSF